MYDVGSAYPPAGEGGKGELNLAHPEEILDKNID